MNGWLRTGLFGGCNTISVLSCKAEWGSLKITFLNNYLYWEVILLLWWGWNSNHKVSGNEICFPEEKPQREASIYQCPLCLGCLQTDRKHNDLIKQASCFARYLVTSALTQGFSKLLNFCYICLILFLHNPTWFSDDLALNYQALCIAGIAEFCNQTWIRVLSPILWMQKLGSGRLNGISKPVLLQVTSQSLNPWAPKAVLSG